MVNKIGNPRVDSLIDKNASKIRQMETAALERADRLEWLVDKIDENIRRMKELDIGNASMET